MSIPLRGSVRKANSYGLRWRNGHPTLSRVLEEIVAQRLQLISEGDVRRGTYHGSALFTLRMDSLDAWRGTFSTESQNHLLEAINGSVRLRIRLMRLALADVAARVHGQKLRGARFETSARCRGDYLEIDLDIEVPLANVSTQAVP